METATKPNHIGRKISRIRELRGMKQEALAAELGMSQQSVSHLEQSESIEDEKLEKVAKALGVTKEGNEELLRGGSFQYYWEYSNNNDNTASLTISPHLIL